MYNLKIGLAQINTLPGNIDINTDRIIKEIKMAQQKGAEIVVFPELSVSGYGADDLLLKENYLKSCRLALDKICAECDGNIIAIIGFPEESRGKLYSSVAILSQGEIKAIHRKGAIPNNELYTENRYFKAGNSTTTIHYKGIRIGIVISEEIFEEQLIPDCDLLLCSAAFPWSRDLSIEREQFLHFITRNKNAPLIYVNSVGVTNNLIMEGQSAIIGSSGEQLLRLKHFAEDFAVTSLNDLMYLQQQPLTLKEDPTEETYKALVFAIRQFIVNTNHQKAMILIDHNIETYLTLFLAKEALGANNVSTIFFKTDSTLPSQLEKIRSFTSSLDVELIEYDVDKTCLLQFIDHGTKANNLEWRTSTLDRFKNTAFISMAESMDAMPLSPMSKTQACLGAKIGEGTVSTTTNMPLLDIYYRKIIKLAEFINLVISPVFDQALINNAYEMTIKSALIDGGKEAKIIDIDEIFNRYIEKNQSVNQIIESGFDESFVISLIRLLHKNAEFRSITGFSPKMSTRSFSNDWIFPFAANWDNLNIKEI